MKVNVRNFTGQAKEEDKKDFDNPKEFINKVYTISKPKDYLEKSIPELCRHFGLENLLTTGQYKCMGWQYDFRPYLKKYVYCQYGHWHSAYAPNKTALRKIFKNISRILEDK